MNDDFYKAEMCEILKTAGWYEGRVIDISEFSEKFKGCGITFHDSAQKFLREFGNLKIIHFTTGKEYLGGSKITTYANYYYDYNEYKSYRKHIGEEIVPIAHRHYDIYMGESGQIYYCFDFQCCRLGDNFWHILYDFTNMNNHPAEKVVDLDLD